MQFSENELNNFYRYCVALTGNEIDAYDLLQDSLEKLIRRGAGLRSPKAYMLRIIRNRFLDSARAEKRAPFGKLPEVVVPINEQSLEHLMANREEARTILQDFSAEHLPYEIFVDGVMVKLWREKDLLLGLVKTD